METAWCIGSAIAGAAIAGGIAWRLLTAIAVEFMTKRAEEQAEETRARIRLRQHCAHLARMNRYYMVKASTAGGEARKLLGLAPTATAIDVQRAFKALVAKAHPDRGGDAAVFRLVVAVKDAALREVNRAA